MANTTNSSTPAVRGFQMGGDASINLFRGDLTMPVSLVDLPGPGGHGVHLRAMYSSDINLQPDTQNLDAPTGILGLGWSLGIDSIAFLGSGTTSYLEGSFVANIDSSPVTLTLIAWQNRGEETESLLFASEAQHPLWTYTYTPATETWVVLRDDGVTLILGAPDLTDDAAVGWGVRWDNWAGNSAYVGTDTTDPRCPQRYARTWNLTRSTDQWGNAITYYYIAEQSAVTDTLAVTRANHISEIVDAYGYSVVFTYGDKQSIEYQPAHTVSGVAPGSAFQDLYATKYLERIDVVAANGTDSYNSIAFGYQVMDLGDTQAGVPGTSDKAKRYLTSVTHKRYVGDITDMASRPDNFRQIQPPVTFTYDLDASSPSRGRLLSTTASTGGTTCWTYAEQTLGDTAIFNLKTSVDAPTGFRFAGLWFGDDYAVIAWYQGANQQLTIQVMQYGGRWAAATPFAITFGGVTPAEVGDLPLLNVAFGSDFFALYWHNQNSNRGDLVIFQKVTNQFGQWTTGRYSDIIASTSAADDETTLVVGTDFVAVHAAGSAYLYPFIYDRRTKTWTPDPADSGYPTIHGSFSETCMALQASGPILAVGFFQAIDNNQVNARYQIYWLDSGGSGAPTFQAGYAQPPSHGPFAWDSAYTSSNLAIGVGFAVASFADEGRATLWVMSWSHNYTSDDGTAFQTVSLHGDDIDSHSQIPYPTMVSGSTIANGGYLYRFNGLEWVTAQYGWSGRTLAGSNDFVIAQNLSLSSSVVPLAQFNPIAPVSETAADAEMNLAARLIDDARQFVPGLADATTPAFRFADAPGPTGVWNLGELAPSGTAEVPGIGDRFMAIGANLYYAGTDFPCAAQTTTSGPWATVSEAFEAANQGSVACEGPTYVAYTFQDTNGSTGTRIALLFNGKVFPVDGNAVTTLAGETFLNPATGAAMCAANAFATYDSADDIGSLSSFNLYRILNLQFQGAMTDTVIAEKQIDTGTQTLRTLYSYDTETALFDSSGTVAQYQGATETRVDANGNSLGSTVYRYLNGLPPEISDEAIADCYSLGAGYIAEQTEFDDSGTEAASAENTWTGVTLTTKDAGGFTPIAGVTLLRLSAHVDTQSDLDIIDLATNTNTGTKGQRTLRTTYTYVPETGLMRAKSMGLYDGTGVWQVRTATRTYAWEVYDGMKAPGDGLAPRLNAEAMDVLQLGDTAVSATATTYVASPDNGAWAQNGCWQWNGSGTVTEGVPAFDFTNPETQSNWRCPMFVAEFTGRGLPKVVQNALGARQRIFYDSSGLWRVAAVANSDGSDCAFMGFEAYELEKAASCAPWSGGTISTSDAHTGSACAAVAAGGSLTYAGLTAAAGQETYVLGCFVKSVGGTTARLVLTVGGTPATASVTAGADWQYVFVYAASSGAGATIDCAIDNAGDETLLVDDIWISPLLSKQAAFVYNPLMLTVAKLGQNGSTTQLFFDSMLMPLAYAGPDSGMRGYKGRGFARGGFDVALGNFNESVGLAACDGGPFDDFRDGDGWTRRWTASGDGSWSVNAGTLTFSLPDKATGTGRVTLNDSDSFSNLAFAVEVHQGSEVGPTSGSFGMAIGTDLTAQWNAETGLWELLDREGTVVTTAADVDGGAPILPASLLLIASPHGAMLFVSQQLTLAHAFASGDLSLAGAVSLFTDANGLGFAQALAFLTPITHYGLSDGANRSVQSQVLADNAITVAGHFYDPLGRATVASKPATYGESAPNGTATVLGYQSGFAVAPDLDSATPTMGGYVNAYYSGADGRSDDGGYPYSRKRLEYSGLSRVLETGGPGAAYAIRQGNTHTATRTYGTSAADPFFSSVAVPAEQYDIVTAADPDGLVNSRVRDQLGNQVAALSSGSGGADVRRLSTVLNERDHPQIAIPPNGYAASEDESVWQMAMAVDYFGRMTAFTTSDTGTTSMIYDSMNRPRFVLTADGAAVGAANPCANQVMIRYTKYDALNRRTEDGYVCQPTWDETALNGYADDPDWPTDGIWRHRYTYDGDGSTPYEHGCLTRVETSAPDGTIVTQTFTHDLQGNKTAVTTTVPAAANGAHTGFSGTVRYVYDHGGRLVTSTTPSLSGADDLTLIRTYDPRGQLATVAMQNDGDGSETIAAYTWDAAGRVASEILGGGTVSRTFTYTSGGKALSIEGNLTQQTLYYDTAPDPQPSGWTARYDGLLSAMTYRFASANSVTWTLTWDDHRRLKAVTASDRNNQSYAYDANGNVTSYNGSPLSLKTGTNQLANGTFTPSGKLAANGEWTFGYDPVTDLPISVQSVDEKDTLAVTFGRGAQRVSKTWSTPADTQARLYLPGASSHAMAEATQNQGGSRSEVRYVRGPLGLAAVQAIDGGNSSLAYVVRDHQGSTRLVVDSAGSTLASFDYRPFGLTTPADATAAKPYPYRYTGQEQDDETGFYNDRHRLYDPATLRFLAPDPAHQYASPYIYVGDDPLQGSDPSGEWSFGAELGMAIGIGEIAVGAVAIGAGLIGGGNTALIGVGGALMGGGIATTAYSAEAGKHGDFHWANWGDAEAGGVIGGAELTAGLYLTLTGGNALAGSTLISMGINGIAYSSMNAGQQTGDFWTGYGISQAAGFVAGMVGGAIGMGGVALGETETLGILGEGAASKFGTRLAYMMAVGALEGAGSSAAGKATETGFTAWSQGTNAGQAYKNAFESKDFAESEVMAAGFGAVGGAFEGCAEDGKVDWFRGQKLRNEDEIWDRAEQNAARFERNYGQLDAKGYFEFLGAADRDMQRSLGKGWKLIKAINPPLNYGNLAWVLFDNSFEDFYSL